MKGARKNRVGKALNLRNMRQVDLCTQTGIAKSSINGWVKQSWQPKSESLKKMAKAMNVSAVWLAGHDVPFEEYNEETDKDNLASCIVKVFEDFLYSKGISVPCEDEVEQGEREINSCKTSIYGNEYHVLMETIRELL